MDALDIVLVVLGSVFFVLTVVALLLGLLLFRRRHRRKRSDSADGSLPPQLAPPHLVFDARQPANGKQSVSLRSSRTCNRPDRIKIPSICEITGERTKPLSTAISISQFNERVERLKRDDWTVLHEEFETLNRLTYSSIDNKSTFASERNMRKNRFPDVIAFDDNRVKLRRGSGENDYINASYIRSVQGDRVEFIASQGPIGASEAGPHSRDNTIGDFWDTVWQESVVCIVMLTQCIEHLKPKCGQYWPLDLGAPTDYGRVRVEMVAESESYLGSHREFDATVGNETRRVSQYHFKDWQDAKGPESTHKLLDLVERLRESDLPYPILVHCSAGIGRTGVFIALWQLLGEMREGAEEMDVFAAVRRLRQQRIRMVQSAEQYASLYEALSLAIAKRNGLTPSESPRSISALSHDSRYEIQEVSAV